MQPEPAPRLLEPAATFLIDSLTLPYDHPHGFHNVLHMFTLVANANEANLRDHPECREVVVALANGPFPHLVTAFSDWEYCSLSYLTDLLAPHLDSRIKAYVACSATAREHPADRALIQSFTEPTMRHFRAASYLDYPRNPPAFITQIPQDMGPHTSWPWAPRECPPALLPALLYQAALDGHPPGYHQRVTHLLAHSCGCLFICRPIFTLACRLCLQSAPATTRPSVAYLQGLHKCFTAPTTSRPIELLLLWDGLTEASTSIPDEEGVLQHCIVSLQDLHHRNVPVSTLTTSTLLSYFENQPLSVLVTAYCALHGLAPADFLTSLRCLMDYRNRNPLP